VAVQSLEGLRVAPFYGCQILRPPSCSGFEDPDRPESLERLITACGAEPIDYPAKVKCCGFPIILAREDVALGELVQPLQEATGRGCRRDGHAVPALPPVARRLAAEGGRPGRTAVRDADPAPGAAARGCSGRGGDTLRFRRHVTRLSEDVKDKLRLYDRVARV
jgi:hypothetical protein